MSAPVRSTVAVRLKPDPTNTDSKPDSTSTESNRDPTSAISIPTLIEQGLDIELENWRAVVAPPGLSESDRQALTTMVERMAHSESWRATLLKLRWTDSYLAGPAFDEFLDAERVRVARVVSRLRRTSSTQAGEWVFPFLVLGCTACVL